MGSAAAVVISPAQKDTTPWAANAGHPGRAPRVRWLVADANILLKDVVYGVRAGRTTTLCSMATTGLAKVVTTPDIIREVREHLARYAARQGADVDAATCAWRERYEPALHVIEPPRGTSDVIAALQARDPDDVPTAQLVRVLGPVVTLSDDRDLSDLGLAPPPREWLTYVLAVRGVAEQEQMEQSLAAVVLILGAAAYGSVLGAVKLGQYVAMRVPPIAWAVIGVGLAIAWVIPASREYLARSLRSVREKVTSLGPPVKQFLVEVSEQTQELDAAAARGRAQLALAPSLPEPRLAREFMLRALAHAHAPMTVDALVEAMHSNGYRSKSAKPEVYIRRLLRQDPLAQKRDDGRWSLAFQRAHEIA